MMISYIYKLLAVLAKPLILLFSYWKGRQDKAEIEEVERLNERVRNLEERIKSDLLHEHVSNNPDRHQRVLDEIEEAKRL